MLLIAATTIHVAATVIHIAATNVDWYAFIVTYVDYL